MASCCSRCGALRSENLRAFPRIHANRDYCGEFRTATRLLALPRCTRKCGSLLARGSSDVPERPLKLFSHSLPRALEALAEPLLPRVGWRSIYQPCAILSDRGDLTQRRGSMIPAIGMVECPQSPGGLSAVVPKPKSRDGRLQDRCSLRSASTPCEVPVQGGCPVAARVPQAHTGARVRARGADNPGIAVVPISPQRVPPQIQRAAGPHRGDIYPQPLIAKMKMRAQRSRSSALFKAYTSPSPHDAIGSGRHSPCR